MADVIAPVVDAVIGDVMVGATTPAINPIFRAPLTNSLLPLVAVAGGYTFARAAGVQTVTDFENLVRSVTDGEARFPGARRAENLATALTSHSIPVLSGSEYQVTIRGDNGATVSCSGGFTGLLTADGVNRVSWPNGTPKLATATLLILTVSGTLTELQIEEVTGQANQNPSEPVLLGGEYGTNVGNVAYFTRRNGNTVDGAGVVTAGAGANIPTTALLGVMNEPPTTNQQINSEALDTWLPVNSPTITTNVTAAPDGRLTTDRVEDTSATLLQHIVGASSACATDDTVTGSLYVKKDAVGKATRFCLLRLGFTGGTPLDCDCRFDTQTGEVLGVNAFSVKAIDLGTYWRVIVTGENNSTGNTLVQMEVHPAYGTGDLSTGVNAAAIGFIDAWGAQVEILPYASSYVPTDGTAKSRAIDSIEFAAANAPVIDGSTAFDFTPCASTAEYLKLAQQRVVLGFRGGTTDVIYMQNSVGKPRMNDGTNLVPAPSADLVAGVTLPMVGKWDSGATQMSLQTGAELRTQTYDGNMGPAAAVRIGGSISFSACCSIKNLLLYDVVLP